MFLNLILFSLFLYHFNCLKKFTIDSQGGNIITIKLKEILGECSSIAITDKGTLIRYKSDSSIISFEEGDNNILSSPNAKFFICQYAQNEIILIKGLTISKITLTNNEEFNIANLGEISGQIFSLQCNFEQKYIITYKNEDYYIIKIHDGSNVREISNSNDNSIKYSSCFFVDESHILCINVLSSEIKYVYYGLSDVPLETQTLISEVNHENKGAIIKYWSNDEILICINSKTSDIDLYCYMVKANPNGDTISISIKSSSFAIIEKVANDIDYCQIEKLTTENLYISICLSDYYRTTYYISIFKFEGNEFRKYDTSNNYINKGFPLLYKSFISITSFDNDSLGIFFRDIDSDSMIFMFYLKCGNTFDRAPKSDGEPENCFSIDGITSPALSDNEYKYDECTHSFKKIPQGYSIYERDQFCKIKKIVCDTVKDYILDDNYNEGTYECWKKTPNKYYYDNSSGSSLFKKCYRSCLTCSGGGNDNNNNCDSCDTENGFYPFEDTTNKPKECHHKDEPIEKYFFDSTKQKFVKCRKECLTCKELSTDLTDTQDTDPSKDTKCLKCDTGNNYWPQGKKPTNCIKKVDDPPTLIEGYFYSDTFKTWEECFPGCKYCTELGVSIYDTKCYKPSGIDNYCSVDYYPVEGEESSTNKNCFKKNVRYNKYYFKNGNNQFKKCHIACLQCDDLGNDEETKCIECDKLNNYFPREDRASICYKYDNTYAHIEKYYYFDPNTKKFRKCQEGCLYCKEQFYPNENDTQCSNKCDTEQHFYPLEDTSGDNLKCYLETKIGYYKEPLTSSPGDPQLYQMKECPIKCMSCALVEESGVSTVKCTECNNDLGYYQLGSSNTVYKECKTIKAENLLSDPGLRAPLNTILVNKIFQYCNNACTKCTALSNSETNTHCQAKQCDTGYSYILNYEDICYPDSRPLDHHFLYQSLSEKYFKPCYETCKTCSTSGNKHNNNCISCREGYIKHPNNNIYPNNCVFDCLSINNYFYLDE